MNKKSKCVLAVGIAIFVLSIVAMIFCFIRDVNEITIDLRERATVYVYYIFIVSPILLEEIVLFRSVHRIFNADSRGFFKTCCIVSASLIFCALVFQVLVFARIITADIFPDGPTPASYRLLVTILLTEWPVIIVSFILGSFHRKVLK